MASSLLLTLACWSFVLAFPEVLSRHISFAEQPTRACVLVSKFGTCTFTAGGSVTISMIRDYTNEVEMLGTALLRSTVMPEFWTSWYTSGRILGTYLHGVFRARLDGSRFALLY
jgi:hypothetical protein